MRETGRCRHRGVGPCQSLGSEMRVRRGGGGIHASMSLSTSTATQMPRHLPSKPSASLGIQTEVECFWRRGHPVHIASGGVLDSDRGRGESTVRSRLSTRHGNRGWCWNFVNRGRRRGVWAEPQPSPHSTPGARRCEPLPGRTVDTECHRLLATTANYLAATIPTRISAPSVGSNAAAGMLGPPLVAATVWHDGRANAAATATGGTCPKRSPSPNASANDGQALPKCHSGGSSLLHRTGRGGVHAAYLTTRADWLLTAGACRSTLMERGHTKTRSVSCPTGRLEG